MMGILFLNGELHAPRDAGSPDPKWTRAITNEELAAFCRCTIRAIEIAFKDMLDRKVIVRKKGSGGFCYGVPFETWPDLPDRPPAKVVAMPTLEPKPAEEESADEAQRPRGQIEPIFTEPQTIKPGGRTRKKELPNGKSASWFQVENQGQVPQQFYPYLCDGVIVIRLKSEEQANSTSTNGEVKRNLFRKSGDQVPAQSTKQDFSALHQLLDDYCLSHHGTIPNAKLLAKIQTALGKATISQFKTVIQARIRSGKVIPIPWFINLAEDAAAGAGLPKPAQYDQMGRPRG